MGQGRIRRTPALKFILVLMLFSSTTMIGSTAQRSPDEVSDPSPPPDEEEDIENA